MAPSSTGGSAGLCRAGVLIWAGRSVTGHKLRKAWQAAGPLLGATDRLLSCPLAPHHGPQHCCTLACRRPLNCPAMSGTRSRQCSGVSVSHSSSPSSNKPSTLTPCRRSRLLIRAKTQEGAPEARSASGALHCQAKGSAIYCVAEVPAKEGAAKAIPVEFP